MRSLTNLKFCAALFAALSLSGCLVSETPVLDARSGKARPFPDGDYLACPMNNDEIAEGEECDRLSVSREKDGGYIFIEAGDDEPAHLRFRKIGRGGYAVQSAESDGFIYYYGSSRKNGFWLVMMNCPDLPADLRARLIARGDLETDDGDFETCTVKTVRGLVGAAKAYHRGEVDQMLDVAILISPAPPLEKME